MAQLVRHDACHFCVGARRFNHPAVEKHRSAGQREGIDLFEIDHVEAVPERRLPQVIGNLVDQPLANLFDEPFRGPVVDERQLLTHFGRRLPTELHVLFRRVAVLVRFDPGLRARGKREDGNDRHSQRSGRVRCVSVGAMSGRAMPAIVQGALQPAGSPRARPDPNGCAGKQTPGCPHRETAFRRQRLRYERCYLSSGG